MRGLWLNEMKTALITGTSSGIGHRLAQHLLCNDWQVIGCSRRDAKFEHPDYTHFTLDLTNDSAVSEMFLDIVSHKTESIALINNAGAANMNHFLISPRKTGEKMIWLNSVIAIDCMRQYAKLLLKKRISGGRIINFSSVATSQAISGQLWYAASKSALETATVVASKELSEMKVTVNCIRIPYFRSPMSGSIGKERVERMLENQAIKRPCTFEDIANAVEFFLNAKSDFITGELLSLGGSG